MRNDVGREIETKSGNLVVIANSEDYLALESKTDGNISFFCYGQNGIALNYCISYMVTKKEFFDYLEKTGSLDEKTLSTAISARYYKIPNVLRSLIVKAYLTETT